VVTKSSKNRARKDTRTGPRLEKNTVYWLRRGRQGGKEEEGVGECAEVKSKSLSFSSLTALLPLALHSPTSSEEDI
jgi:hypothetical protein